MISSTSGGNEAWPDVSAPSLLASKVTVLFSGFSVLPVFSVFRLVNPRLINQGSNVTLAPVIELPWPPVLFALVGPLRWSQ
ncbi:MAG: hypothetical protein J4F36_12295 [Nitrosopumilaceae archaeon]|nr:hypothetical protein [Nitrosopumilaceae archaeon]